MALRGLKLTWKLLPPGWITPISIHVPALVNIETMDSTHLILLVNIVLLLNIICCVVGHMQKASTPKVLMISFDGFRWDFVHKYGPLKNFEKIIKNGVYAQNGLTNAFITKTFPNHYTLVTGLWEESHGIVGNKMYDPVLNQTFTLSNRSQQSDPAWFDNGGEPIWVTNQLQYSTHRSGVIMWPGESAPVKGVIPTRYIPFNRQMKNETRIDNMIKWFTMPYPVNLGLLYFEEPDEIEHEFGPLTPEVGKMIKALDELIGYLLNQLEKHNLLDEVDIIITSDHGFASTPHDMVINLDDIIDVNSYEIFQSNPVANILPHSGKEDEIYSALKKASTTKHFTVYKKEEIPEHFHYKNNRRIQPIVIVAEEHYSISHNNSATPLGNHGWDNSLSDMHPVFLAMGPSFKSSFVVDTFYNVDIYPLLCHLLHLKPAPNNGSFDRVKDLLKDSKEIPTTWATFGTYIFVLVIIALVGGVYMVAACRVHRYLKRKQMYNLSSLSSTIKPGNGTKVPLLSESEEDFP